MIAFLKVFLAIVLLWMCYEVITTCLESNLFEQWHYLGAIPWMRATLWDFYANVVVLSIWVCYKENAVWKKIMWVVLLITLGSIATCGYVLVQLFKLKRGDTLQDLLVKKS